MSLLFLSKIRTGKTVLTSSHFFRLFSYTILKGGLTVLALLFSLFFVILFSVILQVFLKDPYIVAGIIAIAALIAFALFYDIIGLIFVIWILIYVIASFITALLTCKIIHRYHNNDGF